MTVSKSIFSASILGFVLMVSHLGWAQSGDRGIGVGFVIGNPSALSGKWFADKDTAYDLQVSVSGEDYIAVWGDYLFQATGILGNHKGFLGQLESYVGLGPLFVFATKDDHKKGVFFDERDDEFAMGLRVPFGVEWFMKRAPLAVGLEITPGIIVVPATIGNIQGGITLRYYL